MCIRQQRYWINYLSAEIYFPYLPAVLLASLLGATIQ